MKKVFFVMLIWVILITPIWARESEKCQIDESIYKTLNITPDYISLADALSIAMQSNFGIKIYTQDYRIANKEYLGALTHFLPNFQYEYLIARVYGEFLVGGVFFTYVNQSPVRDTISLRWDFGDGGKAFFDSSKTRSLKMAARHDLYFTQDEILLKTSQAYYDLVESKLSLEVYQKNYNERESQLKITETFFKAGMGTKFDVIRARAQLAQAEQNLLISTQKFRTDQAILANLMGIEVFSTIIPVEQSVKTYQLLNHKSTLEDIFNTATSMREDLKGKQKQIDALKAQRSSNYLDFGPKPVVEYQRQYVGNLGDTLRHNEHFALNVVVPLGKRMGAESITTIQKYNEDIKKQQLELEVMKRDLKQSIVRDYFESEASRNRIEPASVEVEAADQSVHLAEIRFKAGEGILLDIIQAQNVKTEARIELIRTMIKYNKAQVQLLFDAGIITPSEILKNYNCQNNKSSQPPNKTNSSNVLPPSLAPLKP